MPLSTDTAPATARACSTASVLSYSDDCSNDELEMAEEPNGVRPHVDSAVLEDAGACALSIWVRALECSTGGGWLALKHAELQTWRTPAARERSASRRRT
jgi:hypothetical protein